MNTDKDIAKKLIHIIDNKNKKEISKIDNKYLKYKNAIVTSYDNTTSIATVKFPDIEKEYKFYNKSGEILTENDRVKVEYTNNLSQGIITIKYGIWTEKENEETLYGLTSLTDYAMLSDTSARCNGIVYDIAKDSATGLITKISDSLGNVLVPEISDNITDATTHNVVFWAVAMARGLTKAKPFTLFNGTSFADGYDIIDQRGSQNTYPAVIADGALVLKHYTNGTTHYNGGVVISPVNNTRYTKLVVEVAVTKKCTYYNWSRMIVARSHDMNSGDATDLGLGDVLLNQDYTTFNGAAEMDTSITRTKYECDISATIGKNVYLGFHHNCNDFYIYSITFE